MIIIIIIFFITCIIVIMCEIVQKSKDEAKLWSNLYLFELKQISNTYKYIQYKLGSEQKPMAYKVHFLESSKLQKRFLQDDSM